MVEDAGRGLAGRMARLAREAATRQSVEEVLETVTSAARDLIPGVSDAGVLLIVKGGKFETHAQTSHLVQRLDELQETFGEGPCGRPADRAGGRFRERASVASLLSGRR